MVQGGRWPLIRPRTGRHGTIVTAQVESSALNLPLLLSLLRLQTSAKRIVGIHMLHVCFFFVCLIKIFVMLPIVTR